MPPPRSLVYSERTGRYRDPRTGRFVTAGAVRADLDRALAESGATMQRLAGQVQRREITVAQFELAMRAEIKTVQLYSAASAVGGFAFMSQADYGRVGQAVRVQFQYLDGLARELEAGLARDGRFTQRVRLYAAGGRAVYHRTRSADLVRRGFTEARSLLHPADHCDLCVSEAEAGWRPAEQVIPIGQRTCLSNDRCSLEHRNPDTGVVAA